MKAESDSCNCNVLNFLKGRSRKLSHFIISPPDVGQYYLKVYAKREGDMVNDQTDINKLDHVATFLIHTLQVKRPVPIFCLNCVNLVKFPLLLQNSFTLLLTH